MSRTLAALTLMAGIATAQDVANGRATASSSTTTTADSARSGRVLNRPTALIALCFPGAGCIVCHNGYCEYTRRV